MEAPQLLDLKSEQNRPKLHGLSACVEGRLVRKRMSPSADDDVTDCCCLAGVWIEVLSTMVETIVVCYLCLDSVLLAGSVRSGRSVDSNSATWPRSRNPAHYLPWVVACCFRFDEFEKTRQAICDGCDDGDGCSGWKRPEPKMELKVSKKSLTKR